MVRGGEACALFDVAVGRGGFFERGSSGVVGVILLRLELVWKGREGEERTSYNREGLGRRVDLLISSFCS